MKSINYAQKILFSSNDFFTSHIFLYIPKLQMTISSNLIVKNIKKNILVYDFTYLFIF